MDLATTLLTSLLIFQDPLLFRQAKVNLDKLMLPFNFKKGRIFMKFILCAFVLGMALTSAAKEGDSDVGICQEIRQEAKDSCKDVKGSKEKKTCYQNEVDRMVDDSNSNTADVSGGGRLECEY